MENRLVKMAARDRYWNSINKKWQYLKSHRLKLIQLCASMFLVWIPFDFLIWTISNLCKLTIQNGRQGPLLKIAYKHEDDDISRTIGWYWSNFVPERFLYKAILIFCNLAFQDGRHLPLLKIAQIMKITKSQ